MFVVGFIGSSGSGKTTLLEKVVTKLINRDKSVSVIKSSHHSTDVDKSGKDSWRYRQAGAAEVMLVGPERWALMRETPEPVGLAEILKKMDASVDFILVEGYKSETWIPRILVWRPEHSGEDIPVIPKGVIAVATNAETLELPEGIEKLPLDKPNAVTNFIVQLKAQYDYI